MTAGIDFALTLIDALAGRETAEAIALNLEYSPAPPFDSGQPESASESVVQDRARRACGRSARNASG